jgi:hypothetical protein
MFSGLGDMPGAWRRHQQQSFKLVELMYTLKRDGADARTTTMGAAVLLHMTARFAHLETWMIWRRS